MLTFIKRIETQLVKAKLDHAIVINKLTRNKNPSIKKEQKKYVISSEKGKFTMCFVRYMENDTHRLLLTLEVNNSCKVLQSSIPVLIRESNENFVSNLFFVKIMLKGLHRC